MDVEQPVVGYALLLLTVEMLLAGFLQFCVWQSDTAFFSNLTLAAAFLLILLAILALEFGRSTNRLVPSLLSVFSALLFCFVHNLVVDHVPNHPKVWFGTPSRTHHF